jgi:hypothetical protein
MQSCERLKTGKERLLGIVPGHSRPIEGSDSTEFWSMISLISNLLKRQKPDINVRFFTASLLRGKELSALRRTFMSGFQADSKKPPR